MATIVVVVVCINAVNFVDGLDGLAAGLIAIGGLGFFTYTYLLTRDASPGDYSNLATLVTAVLVGMCLGFLPHNFYPARIFMGDSGAMLLGLTVAAAAIVVTGQVGLGEQTRREAFPAFLPIVLPIAVLLLPLLDMTLAVLRRVRAGKSPFHPDRLHMHHRLLGLGHSHRRAVLIMYMWTAVFAFGAAALAVFSTTAVLVGVGLGDAARHSRHGALAASRGRRGAGSVPAPAPAGERAGGQAGEPSPLGRAPGDPRGVPELPAIPERDVLDTKETSR